TIACLLIFFIFQSSGDNRHLHSFPTRRSSDLTHLLKLLIQPGDGIDRVVKAIRKAKESIEIMIFRFDRPEIERALIDAVERGLRSEEHTSELQSLRHLVCRLLLEKKKNNKR